MKPFAKLAERQLHFPAIESVAESLVVDGEDVIVPRDYTIRKVELITSGYPSGSLFLDGYPGVHTESLDLGEAPIGNRTNPNDSRWAATTDKMGDGWLATDSYVIIDGPYKDVFLIPLPISSAEKDYEISADVDGDEATATVSVRGPMIAGGVRPTTSAQAKGYKIRMVGSIGKASKTIDVLESKGPGTFTLRSQPSEPVVLVSHRGVFSAPLAFQTLNTTGTGLGALIGGFDKGIIRAELVLEMPFHRDKVLASETIATTSAR